jgi:hypothetical protein
MVEKIYYNQLCKRYKAHLLNVVNRVVITILMPHLMIIFFTRIAFGRILVVHHLSYMEVE